MARRHLLAGLAGGLILLRVAIVPLALTATWPYETRVSSDAGRYHQIASASGTPYRDFKVEQAPVTLALIEIVNGSNPGTTRVRLMWTQLVLDLAIAALLAWAWGKRAGVAYLVLGLPLVVYPFVYLRLDLLSVAIAIGGLALVHKRRDISGGALLAVASLAKLWPLAIAPGLMVTRSWRACIAFLATFAAGVAAWVVWAGPDGPTQVLTYRGARGWEIESSFGALVLAVSHAHVHFEEGAVRVGDVTTWARLALMGLGGVFVLAAWILAARIRDNRARVVASIAPITAISALMLTSTLLSPQYACWLIPFAAIAAVSEERVLAALTAGVAALSTLDILLFHDLVARDAAALGIVIARKALLLALYVVGITRLWRLQRSEANATAPGSRPPATRHSRARPAGPPSARSFGVRALAPSQVRDS